MIDPDTLKVTGGEIRSITVKEHYHFGGKIQRELISVEVTANVSNGQKNPKIEYSHYPTVSK